MTTTRSVAEILRPLAEATVVEHQDVQGYHVEGEGQDCPTCGPPRRVPDPRFEALRYSWFSDPDYGYLGVGSRMNVWPPGHEEGDEEVKRIDASLGAIVRAMKAWQSQVLTTLEYDVSMRRWVCGFMGVRGRGDTPEEAAALALVAAWKGEEE